MGPIIKQNEIHRKLVIVMIFLNLGQAHLPRKQMLISKIAIFKQERIEILEVPSCTLYYTAYCSRLLEQLANLL